jgi:hypothetical protein
MRVVLTCILAIASAPAWAQRLEVTPLVGYSTAANVDSDAEGVQDVAVSRGVTWGAQGTYFISERIGLETLWTYQSTDVSMTSNGVAGELFEMTMHQILGTVVYQFRGSSAVLRPFVFGGIGATLLDATDLDRETKLSWTIGGGAKWFPHRYVGLRAQLRYKPTQLNDGANDFCNPFGFCQTLLSHFELAAGATLRF